MGRSSIHPPFFRSRPITNEVVRHQSKDNASSLGVDPDKIILAGGSAGSNLVSVHHAIFAVRCARS